jgi:hypothetical protein
MKMLRPRTFLELRVGRHQAVEIVVHIRRRDIPWFNDPPSSPDNDTHFAILLHLLQTSILPRMFADEIEENHYSILQKQAPFASILRPPQSLGLGGRVAADPKPMPILRNNVPARRNGRGVSKARQAEMKRMQLEALRMQKKNEKDVYYASHRDMVLTYRLEVMPESGATLIFDQDRLCTLKKLQRRILLWCYPPSCKDDDVTHSSTIYEEGFHRPELIPLSTYL